MQLILIVALITSRKKPLALLWRDSQYQVSFKNVLKSNKRQNMRSWIQYIPGLELHRYCVVYGVIQGILPYVGTFIYLFIFFFLSS